MADKALTPIEEKTVIFYEDEITAVMVQVNDMIEVYVPYDRCVIIWALPGLPN